MIAKTENKVRVGLLSLLVLIQAVVSVFLVVSMAKTGIVSGWVIGLMATALAILLAVNVVFLLVRKKTPRAGQVACVTLAILCSVGGVFAMRYTDAFNGFLDKVTERKPETKSYSVVVPAESGIDDVSALQEKSVGFLKTDTKAETAARYLQQEVRIEVDYYDDMDTLLGVMMSGISDAVVLESDRLELLKEVDNAGADGTQSQLENRNAAIIEMIKTAKIIYTYEIELGEEVPVSEKEVTTEPFIVYISGSDSRFGVKATARSDVNILAVVNPATAKILLVSIPRDTYVQLSNTTGLKDKLTHAGVYGIYKSKSTIEEFLGIKIDHTIKVSFETVVKVVDQLDGIEIVSDAEMTLGTGGNGKKCHYIVGSQTVDGDCALRFARERKSYGTGDLHRGENQQQVITSIINKMTSSRQYLLKVPEILEIAADSFETSLTKNDITKFVRKQITDAPKWQVKSMTVEGTGTYAPTYSMGANLPLYVMIPSDESVNRTTAEINNYLKETIQEETIEPESEASEG